MNTQSASAGPLSDIIVMDFSHGVAAPFCTMLLADLGAEVVKIETPTRGDSARYMSMSDRFSGSIPDSGGDYFLAINRGKRSMTIDLKTQQGLDLARELITKADVVVSNFRPGVMARLGLSYDDVREVNPSAIYASISAYGDHGPLAGLPGMDVAVQARSGVMSITGYPGNPPAKPGASLADLSSGLFLALAITSALHRRLQTGRGEQVEVPLLDATLAMVMNYYVPVVEGGVEIGPMGSGHPQLVPFGAFPTSDGYIVLAIGTNKLFRELCHAIGREDLARDDRFASNPDRVRHRELVERELASVLATKTTEAWMEYLEPLGVPAAPVNDLREAFTQPHVAANNLAWTVKHPVYGDLKVLGSAMRMAGVSGEGRAAPPLLGQHTFEVLEQFLDLSEDEVELLRSNGVV